MSGKLTTFQVIPLLPGHEQELAEMARELASDKICTHIAASMTLVPECDPPFPKADELAKRFVHFRDFLGETEAKIGILAQATIGHGWTPDETTPFQRLTYGDGSMPYQMCPLDHEFQNYIRNSFTVLARLKPDFFMIDDDFRLITWRGGCFCPLHLAEFAKKTGQKYTRESLLEALRKDKTTAHAFDELMLSSLLGLAKIIREAIDESDKTIPVSFCCCIGDVHHADAIGNVLAAPGQTPVIRINNARYLQSGMCDFPNRMYHSAAQIAALAPGTVIVDESDTCPHNRYSTGATPLHAHYTAGIFDGCSGAKHWLTRLSCLELESGHAYRDILTKHQGFYETLFQYAQKVKPAGITAAALPEHPFFPQLPDENFGVGMFHTWGGSLIGLMGISCNYTKNPPDAVMMTAAEVAQFSDTELRHFLSKGMILDGGAAEKMATRGFAEYTGVRVEPWKKQKVSGEIWKTVDCFMPAGILYFELLPICDHVKIESQLIHRSNGCSAAYNVISPGVTLFENALGGRIAVFAGTPGEGGFSGFSFLNETRKCQLASIIEYVNRKPMEFYYPGDAEIYLKYGKLPNHEWLLFILNLGLDELDELDLKSSLKLECVETLAPGGFWKKVIFSENLVKIPLAPMSPVILKIKETSSHTPPEVKENEPSNVD